MLPNLLIIGAAKCGTTSLHYYLDQHPQVSMSRMKEVQVFARTDWQSRIDLYEQQFSPGALIRGEASPAYSMYPRFTAVPERVAATIPHVKLIYLVRDPIERLLAHYAEWFSLHLEDRSLADVLSDPLEPSNAYVWCSRYASQLDRYRERFPESQIMVVDSAELRVRRSDTLRDLFAFLAVEPDFASPRFRRTLNTRTDKRRLNRLGLLAHRGGLLFPAHRLSRRVLPYGLRERSKALVSRRVTTPCLDPEVRASVAALLRSEADRLRDYTGKPFVTWSV